MILWLEEKKKTHSLLIIMYMYMYYLPTINKQIRQKEEEEWKKNENKKKKKKKLKFLSKYIKRMWDRLKIEIKFCDWTNDILLAKRIFTKSDFPRIWFDVSS